MAKRNRFNGVLDVRKGDEAALCMLTWTQTAVNQQLDIPSSIYQHLPSSNAKAARTGVTLRLKCEYGYSKVSSVCVYPQT